MTVPVPRVNLEAMCCLCMTDEEVVLFSLRAGHVPPRFEVPNPVINKIRKLFNITMLQEGMPDKICHNCLIKVDMFYNFNAIVEAGQYKLMVITRNKLTGAETPEGSQAVDNPVLPFNKYKKYSLMRPIEHTHADTDAHTSEGKVGGNSSRITVSRSDEVKTVKVRLKPYSVPQDKTNVPENTPAPKLKSVSLKLQDLMLLKICPPGGPVSITPQPLPQQRFTSQPISNNIIVRPNQNDPVAVPSQTPGVPVPQPSGSQARQTFATVAQMELDPSSVKQEAEEQFECEVCSDTFQLRRPLLRHILTHYRENIYTCHVPTRDCEAKVWFSSSEFREHLVSQHHKRPDNHIVMALSQRAERNSKAEVCFICMASVRCQDSLEEHMQVFHKGYHCCSICKKWFLTSRALQLHSASHEGSGLD